MDIQLKKPDLRRERLYLYRIILYPVATDKSYLDGTRYLSTLFSLPNLGPSTGPAFSRTHLFPHRVARLLDQAKPSLTGLQVPIFSSLSSLP